MYHIANETINQTIQNLTYYVPTTSTGITSTLTNAAGKTEGILTTVGGTVSPTYPTLATVIILLVIAWLFTR